MNSRNDIKLKVLIGDAKDRGEIHINYEVLYPNKADTRILIASIN